MALFKIFRGTNAQVSARGIDDGTLLYTTDLANGNGLFADVVGTRISLNAFLTANKTVYVSPSGSDTTGDGTSGKPYATITKALSVIPKNLNGHDAYVSIANGTYDENVLAVGFHGGMLQFTFASGGAVAINGNIRIYECAYVYFYSSGSHTLTINETTTTPFFVSYSSLFRSILTNVIINGNTTYNGFQLDVNSSATISAIEVNNAHFGVICLQTSKFFANTISGIGNDTGLSCGNNSSIGYGTKTISATTEFSVGASSTINNTIKQSLTSSNLGTVTTHTVSMNMNTFRYDLSALSVAMTSGTGYTVATIPSGFRPTNQVDKNIILTTTGVIATLTIATTGIVTITPRATVTAGLQIYIDEMYII